MFERWKNKAFGKQAVASIKEASPEDYQKIYDQTLRMFGKDAADTIQKIRDGKLG